MVAGVEGDKAGVIMDWEATGALAEVVGAIGVIVSLIYLAIQIRQNTRSQKMQNYQELVMSVANFAESLGRDASSSRIFWKGLSQPEAITSGEAGQLSLLLISFFRKYENVFQHNRQNFLTEEDWEEWSHNMRRLFWLPGVQQWWPAWRDAYHPDFREFLESSSQPETANDLQTAIRGWSD